MKRLAWFVVLGFFAFQAAVTFFPIPKGQEQLAAAGIETIKAGWLLVMGYYFGSSKGSADKTAMLAGK